MTDYYLISRFLNLAFNVKQQMKIIDAAVSERLTSAGYTGAARESAEESFREEAITGCVWPNEYFKCKAAMPSVPFRHIQNLVQELAPAFAEAQASHEMAPARAEVKISPAQRLGLELAFWVADIVEWSGSSGE